MGFGCYLYWGLRSSGSMKERLPHLVCFLSIEHPTIRRRRQMLYVCLFVCLFACLFVCLPLAVRLSVWLSACLSVCLLVGLSACLFLCLFVCLSVQLNVGLCVCLSFFRSKASVAFGSAYVCLFSALTFSRFSWSQ